MPSYVLTRQARIVIAQKMPSQISLRSIVVLSTLLAAMAEVNGRGEDKPLGDPARGQAFFQINCAVCHSPVLGPENTVITKQGPSLVGVLGRPAGSLPYFSYTKAIRESGFTWAPATL